MKYLKVGNSVIPLVGSGLMFSRSEPAERVNEPAEEKSNTFVPGSSSISYNEELPGTLTEHDDD